MKRLFFVLATTAALVSSAPASEKEKYEQMIRDALTSGRPTLLDFGGSSCKVCVEMKPILDAASKEYQGRANIIFVDVWKDKSIGRTYRIQLIPTQIFYDAKGREAARHIGFMDRKSIDAALKKAGVK